MLRTGAFKKRAPFALIASAKGLCLWFCRTVFEGNRPVKYEFTGLRLFRVSEEISDAFKLITASGLRLCQRRFHLGSYGFQRMRFEELPEVGSFARGFVGLLHREKFVVETYFGIQSVRRH